MNIDQLLHPAKEGGCLIYVKASPGAARDQIVGPVGDEHGTFWLHIRVCAAPDKGKANTAIKKMLAKLFGLSLSRIDLRRGQTARQKVFHLSAGLAGARARLSAQLGDPK